LQFLALSALPESFFLVLSLIAAIAMLSPGPRWMMDTAHTILLGIAVLSTVAASAESLELKIFRR